MGVTRVLLQQIRASCFCAAREQRRSPELQPARSAPLSLDGTWVLNLRCLPQVRAPLDAACKHGTRNTMQHVSGSTLAEACKL